MRSTLFYGAVPLIYRVPHATADIVYVHDTCLCVGLVRLLFCSVSLCFIRVCHSHFSRSLLTLCWISHSFAPNHWICVTVSFWHILTMYSRRLLLLSISLRFAPMFFTYGHSYTTLVLYIITSGLQVSTFRIVNYRQMLDHRYEWNCCVFFMPFAICLEFLL